MVAHLLRANVRWIVSLLSKNLGIPNITIMKWKLVGEQCKQSYSQGPNVSLRKDGKMVSVCLPFERIGLPRMASKVPFLRPVREIDIAKCRSTM